MLINDHLEDSSSIARDLAHFEIEIFSEIQYGLNFFQENHTYIRLILISTEIKDFNFKQIMDDFKLLNPSVQIIILSRKFNTTDIIEYMKQGVYDFIDLNSGLDAVKISVNNLLEKSYIIDSSENHFGITQQNLEQMLLNTLTLLDMLLLEDFNSVDDVQEISKNYSNWKKTELDQVDVPSILIVEDEPECNDMFYEFLSGDFNVYSVFDGESCKDILKTESFDIILLDLFLPDMAGSDLVQYFFNSNPSTKIIVITAFDFSREVIDVMRAGASDLLHKPVLKEELITAIDVAWSDIIQNKVILASEVNFFQNKLNDDQKVWMLKNLYIHYQKQHKDFTFFEIFLFYPELKNINFPENFSLPHHINDQTIGTFIESIRSVDIAI